VEEIEDDDGLFIDFDRSKAFGYYVVWPPNDQKTYLSGENITVFPNADITDLGNNPLPSTDVPHDKD